jgi:transposase
VLVVYDMSDCSDKAAGIDVHTKVLVASIVSGEEFVTRSFRATRNGYYELRDWLDEENCGKALMESTGVYWYSLYLVLSESMRVVVANPWHIKHVPGPKTDKKDSRWLAVVCQKDLANPSRVFTGWYHEYRELTRHRETLVKTRTALKNRVHKCLELCNIKLGQVFTDRLGKRGRFIIDELLKGKSIEKILGDKKLKLSTEKENRLREAVVDSLDPLTIRIIEEHLELIDRLDQEIKVVEADIGRKGREQKELLDILAGIPGVGKIGAHIILAEIGKIEDFPSGEQLASYFGLAPSVYQSAGKNHTGHITKQGSPHMRWILVQISHAIGRMKSNRLSTFYNKLKDRKGSGIAAVATARKLLCIIHHLLTHRELYHEEGLKKKKTRTLPSLKAEIELEHAIQVVQNAGYLIYNKKERGGTPG